MSPKEVASMLDSLKSKDAIYIWDGDAELSIRVTATDAVTREPVEGATDASLADRPVELIRIQLPNRSIHEAVRHLRLLFPQPEMPEARACSFAIHT